LVLAVFGIYSETAFAVYRTVGRIKKHFHRSSFNTYISISQAWNGAYHSQNDNRNMAEKLTTANTASLCDRQNNIHPLTINSST
jgi:hypothetical protein